MGRKTRTSQVSPSAGMMVDDAYGPDAPVGFVLPPNTAFVCGIVIVGTDNIERVCAGLTELADRCVLRVRAHPANEFPIYIGDGSVDPAGPYTDILYPGWVLTPPLEIGPDISVFAIADGPNQRLLVTELS